MSSYFFKTKYNMKKFQALLLLILIAFSCTNNKEEVLVSVDYQQHPNLILTTKSVTEIKNQLGSIPLFDETLKVAKQEVDAAIESGIDVPMPKDMAGGYTHTQHKLNYANMQKAGVLYQILDDEKYANYVKDMLMEYENYSQHLKLHPKQRSYARGKLFLAMFK